MTQTRKTIKIFVTDFDCCLLAPELYDRVSGKYHMNPNKHLLCPDLLSIAKHGNYAAFYGCTHRNYQNCYRKDGDDFFAGIQNYFNSRANVHKHTPNFSKQPFYSSTLAENFHKETKLECLAVSTPDDRCTNARKLPLNQQCGYGFKQVHKKIESDELKSADAERVTNCPSVSDKNFQLTQIAHHARAHFDNDTILEIHFFDDRWQICWAISDIDSDSLPNDVIIKSFRHDNVRKIIAEPAETIDSLQSEFIINTKKFFQKLKDSFFADDKPEAKKTGTLFRPVAKSRGSRIPPINMAAACKTPSVVAKK